MLLHWSWMLSRDSGRLNHTASTDMCVLECLLLSSSCLLGRGVGVFELLRFSGHLKQPYEEKLYIGGFDYMTDFLKI